MASDIWLRTILIVRKETRCRHLGYSYRLTARVLLYPPSHRQDSTYHGLCYTSRGSLAGTRNSSMGPPHEGSIRRPIAPWANALPLSYVPLPRYNKTSSNSIRDNTSMRRCWPITCYHEINFDDSRMLMLERTESGVTFPRIRLSLVRNCVLSCCQATVCGECRDIQCILRCGECRDIQCILRCRECRDIQCILRCGECRDIQCILRCRECRDIQCILRCGECRDIQCILRCRECRDIQCILRCGECRDIQCILRCRTLMMFRIYTTLVSLSW